MINETTRQAYLQAMGVQAYFPRTALAGAKPSPEYDLPLPAQTPAAAMLPEVSAIAASAAVRPEPMARPDGSRNPARPVIDIAPKAKPPLRAERPVPVFRHAAKPAASDEPSTLRFDLGYLQLAGGVAVLYELPPVAKAADKERARQLLASILRACDLQVLGDSALASQHEGFSWPMPNDLGLPSHDKAGAAALEGFLRRRHDGDRFDELIVFAGVVEPLVEKIGQQLGYRQALLASLSAMISLASLKREVWADLQPVLERIRTHNS